MDLNKTDNVMLTSVTRYLSKAISKCEKLRGNVLQILFANNHNYNIIALIMSNNQ
jgi:hypothetical protein